MEQQPAVAQVGTEHRIWHGSIRLDTAAGTVVLSTLGGTLTPVVAALIRLVALVMHVPLPVCAVSCVDGTQDRGQRAGGSGVGGSPAWDTPAQRATRPWGHGQESRGSSGGGLAHRCGTFDRPR
jgi:hypothetical protein